MNKIEITNLEIKIGDKILKIDLAEILELKKILNDTFPDPKNTFIPYQPYEPYEIWYTNKEFALSNVVSDFGDKVEQSNSRNTTYLSTGSHSNANL